MKLDKFTIEMTHGQPRDVKNLPKLAAELLISGMPLEIVDGDASHIPLVWVTAVFNELTKLLNNLRIFVLSVLGIQNTGKSTLLNTLFGFRFAVKPTVTTCWLLIQKDCVLQNLIYKIPSNMTMN